MDYSKLSDFEINKRVFQAKAGLATLGYPHSADKRSCGHKDINGNYQWFDFCNNAADAWQIISKNRISIVALEGEWGARAYDCIDRVIDANPLRAAMVVYLLTKESANVQDNPA